MLEQPVPAKLEAQHDSQETEVEQGEDQDVFACFARVMAAVFPESDQAGQGSDQRAGAADIHAYQQVCVVCSELRQQNG